MSQGIKLFRITPCYTVNLTNKTLNDLITEGYLYPDQIK